MPNIPPIRQSRTKPAAPKRAKKPFASEHSTHDKPAIKRRLERRRKQNRRQVSMRMLFDRRQRGISRRRLRVPQDVTAEAEDLSDTVGKHINTTA